MISNLASAERPVVDALASVGLAEPDVAGHAAIALRKLNAREAKAALATFARVRD